MMEAVVCLTKSSSATDPIKISAFEPISSISAFKLNNSISPRATRLKFAPFLAKSKAKALPIPLLAPVINTDLFLIDTIIFVYFMNAKSKHKIDKNIYLIKILSVISSRNEIVLP